MANAKTGPNNVTTIPAPPCAAQSRSGSSAVVRIPPDEWHWASPTALTVRPSAPEVAS